MKPKKRKRFHEDEFRAVNDDNNERKQESSDEENSTQKSKEAKTFAKYEKVKTPVTSKFFRLSKKKFNNKLGKNGQN